MGRPSSCFKIITCGGKSDNEENHAVSESKGSSDKRGWSFRKKSPRHRVLSNTVITETHSSSANKESPESGSLNLQASAEPVVPKKISVLKDTKEKTQLSTFLDAKASELALDVNAVDAKVSDPLLDANAADPKASEPMLDANAMDEKASESVLDTSNLDAKACEPLHDMNEVDAKVSETVLDPNEVDVRVSDTVHATTSVDVKALKTAVGTQNRSEGAVDLEESVVTFMQTSIRGFLAQKELEKRKNVVKLQAVVRGHLVRQHAVGTLRCVQAVIKMQALVRSRIALKESHAEDKSGGKSEKNGCHLKTEGPDILSNKSNVTSVQKLLSNRFARQLIESTPKSKPINIKCDSSKPNSAWSWLERWMSISSAGPSPDTELLTQHKGVVSHVDAEVLPEANYNAEEVSSDVKETTETSESNQTLMTTDAEDPICGSNSFDSTILRDDLKQPEFENESASRSEEISEVIDSVSNHILSMDVNSQAEIISHPSYLEHGSKEQPKRSMKRNASEELQTEGKKFVCGSRKASNPAFVAAHSKFEELTSSTKSTRTNSSSSRAIESEPKSDAGLSRADNSKSKELGQADYPVSNVSVIQVGDSECDTELSISSTLDSPDRSEAIERDSEERHPEEVLHKTNTLENTEVEDLLLYATPVSNSSQAVLNQQNIEYMNKEISGVAENSHEQKQKLEKTHLDKFVMTEDSHVPDKRSERTNLDESLVTEHSHVSEKSEKIELDQPGITDNSHEPSQMTEKSNVDLQGIMDSETGTQAYRSSPEASPRTRVTVSESQGTPSSQVSVKPKKDGSGKRGSSNKRKSLSTGKGSPSVPNPNSGRKGTVEQSSKEQKSGKRRNSFGSTKPEDIDHEPRESSSTSSVPRFMQATESARMKAHANNSPRSSPDVHEKEIYVKKRHSLPGATERQGSPRIQRSTSQAQQVTKGNNSRSPQERKWQR